ncbi:MAG: glycosyltransferase family 4 protein [Acidimicrobiales bacterium]|nr:glycosyltransferase family 4 protein [Acidimicrobiales bacterium]
MTEQLRVAVTLEQCWHRVPGGTASSALGSVRALMDEPTVSLLGVSALHREQPVTELRPPIAVRSLPLPRLVLYESWHWLRWPPVERVTGPVDVIHATGMAVPPRTCPLVVTVHDLAFVHDPSTFTRRGRWFFRRAIELAARQADLVICPSQATIEDCVQFGFDRAQLRLVRWGTDLTLASADDVVRIRRRYGIVGRYVLWAGTIEPRKNLGAVLDAMEQVDPAVQLVVAGPAGWHEDLSGSLARLGSRVRVTGFVPSSDLRALYRGAEVLCWPSLREGFGMPVLEAMAQGTPVITSTGTAMEELVGDSEGSNAPGVLVDPRDREALARELARLLDDSDRRAAMSNAARRRAEAFSWKRTAEQLVAVYREAAGCASKSEPEGPEATIKVAGGVDRRGKAGVLAKSRGSSRRSTPRIGLNLLWLVPGVVGGSEEYTVRLIDAVLARAGGEFSFTAFVNTRMAAAYSELLSRLDTVVAPVRGTNKAARVLAESSWLAWQGRRQNVDLMHHMGGVVPLIRSGPVVVTIHDLQPLAMPEHFGVVKRTFIRLMVPYATKVARRVITLSEFTRQDVVARIGIDESLIELVPSGIAIPRERPSADELRSLRARYGLGNRPFFLYPAMSWPHKNHLLLLHAFAGVVRHHPDVLLVLTSGAAQMEETVRATIDRLGLRGNVRRPGRIPRADLDALYWDAVGLAFPSRYEGFGIPVLEAMARGCPVIAADSTALPEVVGDAGLLVPERDMTAWTETMLRLLDDRELRDRLRKAGLERALSYSWTASADRLLVVYRKAISS